MVGLNNLKSFFVSKISSLIIKAITTTSIEIPSEKGIFQFVNINTFKDNPKNDIVRLQEYGFYSVPLKGGETIVLFPNGSQDEGLIVKTSNVKYDPIDDEIKEGDTMIKHYKGDFIKITDDGIEINSKTDKPIVVNGKNVDINLITGGKFTVAGDNLTVDA